MLSRLGRVGRNLGSLIVRRRKGHSSDDQLALADRFRSVLLSLFGLKIFGRRVFSEYFAPLLLAGVLSIIVWSLGLHPSGPAGGALVEFLIVAASLVISYSGQTWLIGPIRPEVLAVLSEAAPPDRKFVLLLAKRRLNDIPKTLRALVSKEGVAPENPQAFQGWFGDFFADHTHRYVGVDTLEPGEFWQTYRWYLDIHEQALREAKRLPPPSELGGSEHLADCRVLVTTAAKLYDDYYANSDAYEAFIRWHKTNGVSLRWKSVEDAERLARDFDTVEVGLWQGRCAVLFIPPTEQKMHDDHLRKLRIAFPRDDEYSLVRDYATEMANAEVLEGLPNLEIVEPDVAEAWNEYLGVPAGPGPPPKRLIWEVLDEILAESGTADARIFDAAAGSGWDCWHLMQQGHQVWCNEVDPLFRRQCEETFGKNKPQISLFVWEDLSNKMPAGWLFDLVLVLGNSISLVLDPGRRKVCLQNFYRLVKPGGHLVIDERNFQFMLDRKEAIEADPVTYFPPTTLGDVMYQGSEVRAYPPTVGEKEVEWHLIRNSPAVHSGEDLRKHWIGKRHFTLYPFPYGRLYQELSDVGFTDIRVVTDLDLGSATDGLPRWDAVQETMFFTYVARKSA